MNKTYLFFFKQFNFLIHYGCRSLSNWIRYCLATWWQVITSSVVDLPSTRSRRVHLKCIFSSNYGSHSGNLFENDIFTQAVNSPFAWWHDCRTWVAPAVHPQKKHGHKASLTLSPAVGINYDYLSIVKQTQIIPVVMKQLHKPESPHFFHMTSYQPWDALQCTEICCPMLLLNNIVPLQAMITRQILLITW